MITRVVHALALNYKGIASDNMPPLYFIKSVSGVNTSNRVSIPKNNKTWVEVELGVMISKKVHNISKDEAQHCIQGFLVCSDVTTSINTRDHHLAESKSRDGYCLVSPIYELSNLVDDAEMTTHINGRLTQKGRLSDAKLNIYESISFVSKITSLEPGDILISGTPCCVDKNDVRDGDHVKHSIERLGEISFRVEEK